MGETGILIITICSNNKKQGGGPFVKENPSLLAALSEHASTIIKKRRAILNLLEFTADDEGDVSVISEFTEVVS
jgi:hypothetical protein